MARVQIAEPLRTFHHYLLHGGFGALLIVGVLTLFARKRSRVAVAAFLTFHLHLMCDLLGSRGPSMQDLWPVYYLGPFAKDPVWLWKGQWRLDGWQNRLFSVVLLIWAFRFAVAHGFSFVGVFSERADAVFTGVLRKWLTQFREIQRGSRFLQLLTEPPWRTVFAGFTLIAVAAAVYAGWRPGLTVSDGRHDLKRNGIWLSHGWLGADAWFQPNRVAEIPRFRQTERIRELAALLRENNIRDVFPHLCPSEQSGALPPVDHEQADRFLSEFTGFRVMPWIGGVAGDSARYKDPKWRAAFVSSATNLLIQHPRFSGLHVNIEPLPSGDEDFLKLLDELGAAMPRGRILSVAAYPPPTLWHPYPDIHWDENFFRSVSRRCDQIAVMMYDTGLRNSRLYQQLMAAWTDEVVTWSERTPVLLGVPVYDDAESGYHDPAVENLTNALMGIHRTLAEDVLPANYQGIAIYCEWEMSGSEWGYWRNHFAKVNRR